jgi:serine/threonine protein kinase/tetratricopeptide (TPR) repeat protein
MPHIKFAYKLTQVKGMQSNPAHIDNRYEILSEIGAGGMGHVLRARDRLTGEDVALKRVSVRQSLISGSHSDELRLALAREFQATAALRHPQIVRVLDYGFDDKRQPFLVMELLEKPLDILRASVNKSPNEKLKLLVQALHAIHYLHRRGVLHRDIKPANILVVGGNVKLVDFGLATAKTQNAEFAGTFGYIAPELILGGRPSESSDLYAIGVVAYEMTVGRHPFNLSDKPFLEAMQNVIETKPDADPLIELHRRGVFDIRYDDTDNIPLSEDAMETTFLPIITDEEGMTQLSLGEPTLVGRDETATSYPLLKVPQEVEDEPLPAANIDVSTVPGIIMRLLNSSPAIRYQDAAEVIRDLNAAIGENLPVETPETRESFLQAAQFIGRKQEFDTLSGALHKAREGHGSVWFVSGESGVGKTRLFDEVRIRALIDGALAVRGYAPESAVSYQVWREPLKRLVLNVDLSDADAAVLREVIPDIENLLERTIEAAPQVEPDEAAGRLTRVVTALLRAQKRPVVIILEDIHWITTESLTLLQAVQEIAPNLPLLVLANFRDDENIAHLEDVLAGGSRIKLARLQPDEIAQLSESIIGLRPNQDRLVDFLARETEGNIFFVVEVMRALAEEAGQLENITGVSLPARVFAGGMKKVLDGRLNRVPARAMPLLQTSAVIGRVLDLKVLSKVKSAYRIDDWLFDVSRVAVLEIRGDQWQFTHDKLRQALIERMSDAETQAAHQAAALAIETAYPGLPQYAGALATHWGMAGDYVKEAEYSRKAGEYDYQIGQYSRAVARYERTMDILKRDEAANRHDIGRLMTEMAKAYWRLGEATEARSLLETADGIAQRMHYRQLAADIRCQRGRFALVDGNLQHAQADLIGALELFQQLDDLNGMADAMTSLGQVHAMNGAYALAEPLLTRTLEMYRALGQVRGVAHAYFSLAEMAVGSGELEAADKYLNESLTLTKTLGTPSFEGAILIQMGMIAHYRDAAEEAHQKFQEALRRFEEAHDRHGMANSLNNLGFLALSQNELEEAEKKFQQSLPLSEHIGDQWGMANTLANIGHVKMQRGEAEQAVASYLDALERATSIGALPVILELFVALAPNIKARDEMLALAMADTAIHHPAASPDVLAQASQLRAEHFPDKPDNPAIPLDRASIQSRIAEVLRYLAKTEQKTTQ